MRREFPAKVKALAFERCHGACETCTRRLFPGDIHYDHRIADGIGGEPTLENCQVLCKSCHAIKTNKSDIPTIAKSKRVRRKHIGASGPKRTIPGRRFNGEPIYAARRS